MMFQGDEREPSEQVSSRVRITNLDKAKVRHYNMIRMDSVSVSFFEFY
jgi:hypothetical protein